LGLWAIAATQRGNLPTQGKVVSAYDGDTLTVEAHGEKFSCRLLGIDTPEMSYARLWTEMEKVKKYAPPSGRRELNEAEKVFREWAAAAEGHGKAARDALAKMTLGKTVQLQYDTQQPKKDQYGRLLVYVTVGGTDVNAEILKQGLAVADTRFTSDRLNDYVRLWRTAQRQRVGIWSAIPKSESLVQPAEPRAAVQQVEFWASRQSDKYHLPSCRWAKRIAPGNLVKFRSVKEAKQAGYKPCGVCKPPAE